MAYPYFWLDDTERLPTAQWSQEDNLQEDRGIRLYHSWPICWRYEAHLLVWWVYEEVLKRLWNPKKTFLGMELEQKGQVIKLDRDYYIQQVLKECKEYIIKRMHRPKKVPILPGVSYDITVVLDQRKQKYYQSFVAKLQFAGPGFGWMYPSQYLNWLVSVLQQVMHNGQPCNTLWNILRAIRASRLHINGVTGKSNLLSS